MSYFLWAILIMWLAEKAPKDSTQDSVSMNAFLHSPLCER